MAYIDSRYAVPKDGAPESGGTYRMSGLTKKIATTGLLIASLGTYLAIGGCSRKPESAPQKTYQTAVQTAVCRASIYDIHYEVIGKRVLLYGFDDRSNPCIYEMSRDNFCSMYDLCKSKPTPIKRKLVAPKPKPHPAQPVKTAPVPPAAPHAEAPKPQGTPPAPQVSRYPVEVHELKPMPLDKFEKGDFVLERCK